jgi:hypothetical protein
VAKVRILAKSDFLQNFVQAVILFNTVITHAHEDGSTCQFELMSSRQKLSFFFNVDAFQGGLCHGLHHSASFVDFLIVLACFCAPG